jgi:hypothetical protein
MTAKEKQYDPDGNVIGDDLPRPSQGVHGETMGAPQPLVKPTSTGPGGVPNTEDDLMIPAPAPAPEPRIASPLETLPREVSHDQLRKQNEQYWAPNWGTRADRDSPQAPTMPQSGPKADKTEGGK